MVALILMTASIYEIKENSEDVMKYMPVTNKVIILDAGHGGIDSGTLNDDKTILEKDINLAITHKIRELLESSGAHVILTREDDSSLYVEDGKKTIRQKYNENLKNRTIKRIRWIINEIVPSNDFFHLLRTISCYIDVFSGVSSHLSKENDYNGDYHEIDGLSFCDADILNLRRDYATEQLESLLINTAIAAERQKEKPEVFWKRNES